MVMRQKHDITSEMFKIVKYIGGGGGGGGYFAMVKHN